MKENIFAQVVIWLATDLEKT